MTHLLNPSTNSQRLLNHPCHWQLHHPCHWQLTVHVVLIWWSAIFLACCPHLAAAESVCTCSSSLLDPSPPWCQWIIETGAGWLAQDSTRTVLIRNNAAGYLQKNCEFAGFNCMLGKGHTRTHILFKERRRTRMKKLGVESHILLDIMHVYIISVTSCCKNTGGVCECDKV